MSQSVVLACTDSCDLSVLSGALEHATRSLLAHLQHSEREVQIVGMGHSFYVTLAEVRDPDTMALEYEENEDLDAAFRREVLSLRFYSLSFDDFEVAKRVLGEILARLGALGVGSWIDTDYGWVIRGVDALACMSHEPSWDWRKVTSPPAPS